MSDAAKTNFERRHELRTRAMKCAKVRLKRAEIVERHEAAWAALGRAPPIIERAD